MIFLSLTKPILNSVVAWDVADGQTFTFSVIGGDAVTGNTLYIINNNSSQVAYSIETESFKYESVVPANVPSLHNGIYYSAYVVTKGTNNSVSEPSNTIQFYCYSTPQWGITNITEGSTVTNSSIVPTGQYSQAEGERLNDYTFTLYNSSKIALATSGPQYPASADSTLTFEYSFGGLENNTDYFIRLTGHTVQDTVLDTDYISFVTSYITPEAYSVLELYNNCDEGYIVYNSKAIGIAGESYPSPPTYTENGVDLTAPGSYVVWNSGFEITDNFTLKAWLKNPTLNSDLISLQQGKNGDIVIGYVQDPENINNTLITVTVNGTYFIYSDSIPTPASTDLICVQVRRINNIYHVLYEVVE